MSKQIKTDIEVTYKKRNKTTVFWRGILVFPVLIFICSFAVQSNAGFAAGFIILPALLALVFREVYPSYLLTFNHAFIELQTRVVAYVLLLTDEYPSIEENDVVSVTFPEVDAKQLNRWLPLIKWLLALPLYLVGIVYFIYAALLTLLGWFSILFTGNYPEVCAEGVVGTIAYWNRVVGYAFLLVTDEYPTFSL